VQRPSHPIVSYPTTLTGSPYCCIHWQAATAHYNGAADFPLEPYSGEAAALPPPPPQADDYYDALPACPTDRPAQSHEQEQGGKRRRGLWATTVGWVVDGLMGTAGRLCESPRESPYDAAATAPAAQHYQPTLYTRAPRHG
jgi:hypothetical protein